MPSFSACAAVVVDVVRLVVEHGQFVDFPDDLAQIDGAVVGLADRPVAERSQEVVAQIVVIEGRLGHVAEIDTVNVGQEDVAGRADDPHFVLNVQRHLKVIAPILPGMAVVREHGVVEEDAQPVEVGAQAIEYDDVGRDQQEVARQC